VHHAAIGYLAAHGWLRRGGAWYTQLAKKWWVVGRARRPARVDGSARPTASGGPTPEIVRVDRVLGPSSTTPVAAPDGAALAVVRFHNAVPFTAHYDGNTLALAPDARALATGARAIEDELARTLGADFRAANQGSVLPHAPSARRAALLREAVGLHGDPRRLVEHHRGRPGTQLGRDAWRGVVWTDRFHATPAVFSLQVGRRVQIAAGAPLLDVVPFPRSLAARASRSSAKADHGLRAQRPPTRR